MDKTIASVLNQLNDAETLYLPSLSVKAEQALASHPDDATIGQVARVLKKMANEKLTISRSEFKKLYRHFYTRNNQFIEVFASEMGVETQPEVAAKPISRFASAVEPKPLDLARHSDEILSNALESAFDRSKPIKGYSKRAGEAAAQVVRTAVTEMGLDSSVSVADGTEHAILVNASVETPRGHTSILVPVEVVGNQAVPPVVFFSNAGVEDFDRNTVVAYVTKTAGQKLVIGAAQAMELIRKAEAGSAQVNSVELAVTQLNATKENQGEYFADSVTGLKVEEVPRHVATLSFVDPEMNSFACTMDTPAGGAAFLFGEPKVAAARRNLVKEFSALGHGRAQAQVNSFDKDSVSFAVKLASTAFIVPVSMTTGADPTVFIVNGSVHELSKENINTLMKSASVDNKAAAVASGLYGTKPSELIENLRVAMASNDLVQAESIISAINETDDDLAKKTALQVYMGGLSPVKTAEVETCCSRIVRTAHSKFNTCGHTGLPVHKVYQDKNGDCQPLYRRAMSETQEGGYFMSHKVLF